MMATTSVSRLMETGDFQEKMASFPCMFNMPCYEHPVRQRLKNRRDQLSHSINEGIDDKEELRKVQNTLTWIFYQLGLYDRAIDMNTSVLVESGYKCAVALGNCVFMDWLRTGRVSEHYNLLVELSEKPDFKDQVLEAKAQQAYCLGQLGKMFNLMRAANIYELVLASTEHDLWRYLMGLTYRRLAHMRGIEKQSGNTLNETICHRKAKECFEKVARCSDKRLMATSSVNIASYYAVSKQATIAGVLSAARMDPNSSEVHMIGGRALVFIDVNEAVTLLERAVEIDPKRSVSHHQLGKAYVHQLKFIGQGNLDRAKEIQQKAERHFQLAYEMSSKLNLTPVLDLACLLKRMGKDRRAEIQALAFLKSRYVPQKLFIQLSNGHKMCFQLSKSAHHLYLSFLTSVALFYEEPTNTDRNAICSTLFERDQTHAPGSSKLKISTVLLLQKFEMNWSEMDRIRQSISRLVQGGQIDDAHAVVGEALAIATQGLDAEALLFLELVSFRKRMDTSEFNRQRLNLLITEAKLCLKESLNVFYLFFRQSFDLIFNKGETHVDELESDSDISIKMDIVVLFNDSIANFSTLCADTAYGLENAISYLYGLKVAFNPIVGASSDGGQGANLVDFVKKHAIVVILVVFEGDGAETQYLLEKLGPFLSESNGGDEDRRPVVVMIQCDDQPTPRLPAELKNLPCLRLGHPGDKFPNLFCLKETQEEADTSVDVSGFVQAYFEGNDDNVMTLFKHLTRCSDQ